MFYQELFSQSWKYLWQSKLFWLYSALAVSIGLISLLPGTNSQILYCLTGLLGLPLLVIGLIGQVGMIQTAYQLSMDQQPDRRSTWVPLGSLGVVFLLGVFAFVIAFLLAIVFFFLIAAYVAAFTTTTLQRDAGLLVFSALMNLPFGSLCTFFYCSSVIREMGVGKGVRHALDLIVRNLGKVTIINILLGGLYVLLRLFLTLCVLFLQSGYSLDFLSSFGFSAYFSVTGSGLFIILSLVGGFLLTPYQTSVVTLAYVKMVQKDEYESQNTA